MSPADPVVAVLGLGIMGSAILEPLRNAPFRLRLYNRTHSRAEALARPGEEVAESAASACRDASYVVSFLADDPACERVWMAEGAALDSCEPGAVVVECSTVSRVHARRWVGEARARELRPVVAPVTGSRQRATEGTLVVFAGGSVAEREAAHPLLSVVGGEVVAFDSGELSASYKLLHNLAAAHALASLAEVLNAAEEAGLPGDIVVDTLSRWGWAAPVASARGQSMLTGDYGSVDCKLVTLSKDVRLALELTPLDLRPVSTAVAALFEKAVRPETASQDMAAVRSAFDEVREQRSF